MHCTALNYTALYSTALQITALYYNTLYFTVLHYANPPGVKSVPGWSGCEDFSKNIRGLPVRFSSSNEILEAYRWGFPTPMKFPA